MDDRIVKAFSKDYIDIRGARENNLRDINVRIPRNKLVVINIGAYCYTIGLGDMTAWMHNTVCKFSVIGEEEKSL